MRIVCIIEVMTSHMEKFGQREPVEGVVDDLLNAAAASEFNKDLDINYLIFPIIISFVFNVAFISFHFKISINFKDKF